MVNTNDSIWELENAQGLLADYFAELERIEKEYQKKVRQVFEDISKRKLEEVQRKIKEHDYR